MSQQAADARRQLSSIDYRHFQNIDDYLSSCERVRVLIPTLESFCKWSDAELERLRIKHSDNPHLLELADFYVSLNWLILPIFSFERRHQEAAFWPLPDCGDPSSVINTIWNCASRFHIVKTTRNSAWPLIIRA
jgi:hypothetical protein